MKIAVVTPVGNEQQTILLFIANLYTLVVRAPFEIVWVPVTDAYCTDGTDLILDKYQRRYDWVKWLHHEKGGGLAAAYLAGFRSALEYDVDYVIEADVGHPVELIPEMVTNLGKVNVVWGARRKFLDTAWYRRLLSWGGSFFSHLVLGMTMSDCTSGFEGFHRDLVKRLLQHEFMSRGHMFQTEVKRLCAHQPYREMLFDYSGGESSLKFSAIMEAIRILFRLRHVEPMETINVSR